MNKNCRVLLLGPRSINSVTGVSLAFDLLIKGLKERDISYTVVDFTSPHGAKKSGSYSLKSAFYSLRAIFKTWVRMHKVDVFYATMSTSSLGFLRDFMTVGAAYFFRKKVIMHLHGGGFGDFYKSSNKWMRYLILGHLNRVNNIIVLGNLLKQQFDCVSNNVKDKLLVVPNGLTLGVNDPTIKFKTLQKEETINLTYLSSLMPSKGFMYVILALEILKKQSGKKYHLDICGNFINAITEKACELKNHEDLLTYIKDNNLGNDITYHGQVLGSDKESLLKKAHVFLLPTYYPWEGQPLSIIEAMAYATPIISCKHRGIPEMIDEGINGHFVMPKDPKDIAEKIKAITSSSDKYMNYSEQSRIKYEKDFRREVHLNRLISHIWID